MKFNADRSNAVEQLRVEEAAAAEIIQSALDVVQNLAELLEIPDRAQRSVALRAARASVNRVLRSDMRVRLNADQIAMINAARVGLIGKT